jgi:hypothetical protein
MVTITLPILASIMVTIIILFTIYEIMKLGRWGNKGRFISVLITIVFSALFFIFIIGFRGYLESVKPPDSLYQLGVIPLFLIEYLLMALNAVAIAKWKNGGAPLRSVKGLHFGLRAGFVLGLFSGVISWITLEFPGQYGTTPSGNMLETLIICTGITLTLGYLFGVSYGFRVEFKDYPQ